MTATTAARKDDTISLRRSCRMPPRQTLEQEGMPARDLRNLIDCIQGDDWLLAFDRLQLATAGSPPAIQATSALTLEAIAHQFRQDDAPTAAELLQGLFGFDYPTADPSRMRICYQLLLQAENDATGPTGDPDRFAEFTTMA